MKHKNLILTALAAAMVLTGAMGSCLLYTSIVLLIDDSNSMYPSLMPKVRDAINNYLVAEINQELNKEKPTIYVRWKILKFYSSASNVTSSWIETKDVAGYVNRINSGSGRDNGGTNYQACLLYTSTGFGKWKESRSGGKAGTAGAQTQREEQSQRV